MGLIKRWLIKKALKKVSNKSDVEKVADEVLKDALKELQQTNRTADKILQSKLIRQESQHALRKIQELDEEFEEEEDEGEAPDTMEDTITKALIQKFLGGAGIGKTPEALGNSNLGQLAEVAKNLSPSQIEELKKKFIG